MSGYRTPRTAIAVLLLSVAIAPAGLALGGEPLPDRQGFGYTIKFTSGFDAATLRPVATRQPLIERQGFGYTINFVTGDPADSLFPPGWAKQRAANRPVEG
jgi:hypothetical protein